MRFGTPEFVSFTNTCPQSFFMGSPNGSDSAPRFNGQSAYTSGVSTGVDAARNVSTSSLRDVAHSFLAARQSSTEIVDGERPSSYAMNLLEWPSAAKPTT